MASDARKPAFTGAFDPPRCVCLFTRVTVATMHDLGTDRRGIVETATADLRTIEHDIKERLRAKGLRRVDGDGPRIGS